MTSDDGRWHAVLLDPNEATLVRVDGNEFEDGCDRILTTWDNDEAEVRVALLPDAFMSLLVAALNALGFPEQDLEYLAQRYTKEIQ